MSPEPDPSWDFRDRAGRPRLLAVLQREIDAFTELVSDPARWNDPTACAGWKVRDMVGHLVDATESYLAGFDIARSGDVAGSTEPVGVAGMASASDEAARSFRNVDRATLLARLRTDTSQLMRAFGSLSDDEWPGLIVPDRYMGPLPAMILAAGLLAGYTVHGWDVRQGRGEPHSISGDAADLLVPFVFLLWWATADTAAVDMPYEIGVRTSGRNGGDTRCTVSEKGLRFEPGDVDGCSAIIECDPGTLVLTAYGRLNGGTVRGDEQLAAGFRSLFVSI
ncbi:MAG TPA: maleylpyruvate isomerase family mycothiol-dependent enzyme [Acidimicrobiia bacterium]